MLESDGHILCSTSLNKICSSNESYLIVAIDKFKSVKCMLHCIQTMQDHLDCLGIPMQCIFNDTDFLRHRMGAGLQDSGRVISNMN